MKDVFPIGEVNPYSKYFIGTTYLHMLSNDMVVIGNVTFAAGARNNWHIHNAQSGGGQILLVTSGAGWYQEWGKTPQSLKPGDVVHIRPGVKHWKKEKKDSEFTHLAIEVPGENVSTSWLEPVLDDFYNILTD